MTDNLPQPADEPIRRRRPRHGTSIGAPGEEQGLIPYEQGEADRARASEEHIASGQSFRPPDHLFPEWKAIFEAVTDEFVKRSGKVAGGAEVIKREDEFHELVVQVLHEHPEFKVAPVDTPDLVALLRSYQFGYGALEKFMAMDGLEEIYFNHHDQGFYILNGEKKRITDKLFSDRGDMVAFVHRVATENGLSINMSRPNLDATLRDGSRLNATIEPIAYDGPDFVIRKHREIPFTMEFYVEQGMITQDLAADLERWVRHDMMNIVVSGGTGSGKTSLLNALGTFMPRDDRLNVLENRKELQLYTDDYKYFQTREDATREGGEDDITMKDLVRFTLRKRPDRIIVGEVRGGEAYHALTAWNSGHEGSLCTVHANSAPAALMKLEQLASLGAGAAADTVNFLIADAVDIIVQVRRQKRSAKREVREVIQVLHSYKFDIFDEEVMARVEELKASGQLRNTRGDIWILPLYRLADGELVRVNAPLPIQGRSE